MRLLLIACTLFLAGCSAFRPEPLVPEMPDQNQALTMSSWMMQGRIGIRQPDRNDSASMEWLQQGRAYRISLFGPVGQTVARLEGRSDFIEISLAGDDERYIADTPEQLMQHLMGWSLPVSHAVFWIRGLTDPDLPFTRLDGATGEVAFQQAGWEVRANRYQQVNDALLLPGRIRLTHDELGITLVIHNWEPLTTL